MSRGQSAQIETVGRGRAAWVVASGIAVGVALTPGSASGAVVAFQSLGTTARANAVSADGSTVVGNGFVWRSGTGLSALPFSRANGVSADGSIIVGRSGSRAVRWDGSVLRDLDTFGWGEFSTANGVSGDGSVVIGNGATNGDFQETRAYRWTSGSGTESCSPEITGGLYEGWGAMAATDDGGVVVGNQGYHAHAFRWTSGGGAVELFPDLAFSTASDVSSNGSIIAATIAPGSPSERRAARLVLGSTVQLLGELSGGEYSATSGISGDGSVIVGKSGSTLGDQAAVWTTTGGVRSVGDILSLAGVSGHVGWTLSEATAISSDGSTIVGQGINPQGFAESWMATIPAPGGAAAFIALGTVALGRRRR